MAVHFSFNHMDFVEETTSTNVVLEHLAEQQPEMGATLLYTDFQTGGKGHAGNSWESARGQNCLFSFYVPEANVPAADQFVVSKIACLAVVQAIEAELPGLELKVKWPNDIYAGRKKLAGLLIQHKVQNMMVKSSIVGIGLNVNQVDFVSDAPNPISLTQLCGKEFDRKHLIHLIAARFEVLWGELVNGKEEEIHQAFHQSLFALNRSERYRYQGDVVEAVVQGVDEYGRLVLVEGDRLIVADFKEIALVH